MSFKLQDGPTSEPRPGVPAGLSSVTESAAKDGNCESAIGKSGSQPPSDGPSLAETLDYVMVLAAQLKKLAQAAGFGRLGLILMMAEQEAHQQLHRSGAHQSGEPAPDGMGSPAGRQG